MGRDASLDEFLGSDEDGEADTGAVDAEPDGVTADDGEADGTEADGAVEPAVPTLDWTPGGAPCAACGATVERRWRDDGRMVCGECKGW